MAPRYSLDTSALIEPWKRLYPYDVFPAFWDHMAGLFASGGAIMIDQVRIEIEKRDDELQRWVLANAGGADPFVIALARTRSLVVVSEEKKQSLKNPKIPDVCDSLGVQCLGVVGMMRQEGWRFG